ncbi:hypothetical protein DRE_00799 [Drechslerella stenobrocha 248]|uniref:Uncharacterized protein n=1 Tax=Drechslerella stenobrocha 248 TaxID=1043628 RepID=W7I8N8_9PEZI|nr:hypothetical protein DRE_00799 [Drechslerella stenobrocha 248]
MARYQLASRQQGRLALASALLIFSQLSAARPTLTATPTPSTSILPQSIATATSIPTSTPTATGSDAAATSAPTEEKGPSMLITISYFGIAVCGSILIIFLLTAWISRRRKRRPEHEQPMCNVRTEYFEYIKTGDQYQGFEPGPMVVAETSPQLGATSAGRTSTQDATGVSPSSNLLAPVAPEEEPKSAGKFSFKSAFSSTFKTKSRATEETVNTPSSSPSRPALSIDVTPNPPSRPAGFPEYFIPKRLRRESTSLTATTRIAPTNPQGHMQVPPMPRFETGGKVVYPKPSDPVTPVDTPTGTGNGQKTTDRNQHAQQHRKSRGSRYSDVHRRGRRSRGVSMMSQAGHGHNSRRPRPISSTTIASSVDGNEDADEYYYDYDDYDVDVDGDDDYDYDDRYSYDASRDYQHKQQRYNKYGRDSVRSSMYRAPLSHPPPHGRHAVPPPPSQSHGLGIQTHPHNYTSAVSSHELAASPPRGGYAYSSSGKSAVSNASGNSKTSHSTDARSKAATVGGSSLRHVHSEATMPPPVPPKDWEVVPINIGGFPTFVAAVKPSVRVVPATGLPMNPRPGRESVVGRERWPEKGARPKIGRI